MSTRARIRKFVKWGGLAVCAGLVVVCWLSNTHSAGWHGSGGHWCIVSAGRIELGFWDAMRGREGWAGWRSEPKDPGIRWGFYHWSTGHDWRVAIPLWPVILLTAAYPLALVGRAILRSQRWSIGEQRRKAGQCEHCGYALAGLSPGAVCPECGRVPKSA